MHAVADVLELDLDDVGDRDIAGAVTTAAFVAYTFHIDPVTVIEATPVDFLLRLAAHAAVAADLERQRAD